MAYNSKTSNIPSQGLQSDFGHVWKLPILSSLPTLFTPILPHHNPKAELMPPVRLDNAREPPAVAIRTCLYESLCMALAISHVHKQPTPISSLSKGKNVTHAAILPPSPTISGLASCNCTIIAPRFVNVMGTLLSRQPNAKGSFSCSNRLRT